jgi:cytochrome c oxidase assembly protein subunit 15
VGGAGRGERSRCRATAAVLCVGNANFNPIETMNDSRRLLSVRIWLWTIAALIAAMVIVGGATRLTQSGLSITHWNLIRGVIPPLDTAQWMAEFRNYQQIPQYHDLNRGMTLAEFQGIFWWEWAHRLLGRVIGFAFAVPLIVFWWRGLIRGALARRLAVILGLGALQGLLGWWMVSSGLVGSGRTSVLPYRLAMHLTLAVLLYAAVVWTARSLRPNRDTHAAPAPLHPFAWLVLVVAFVQLFLGAVTAGLHAGLSFNTWPLMDGAFIPDASTLLPLEPIWRNLFENPMTAQFVHRMVAYLLFTVTALFALAAWAGRQRPAAWRATALFAMVVVQATLGILTLLYVVPLPLALTHQFGALIVIALATVNVEALTAGTRRATAVLQPGSAPQRA